MSPARPPGPDTSPPPTPSWQTLLGMGVVIAAVLAIGLGLGWFVDSLLDTSPIFTLIGLAAGLLAAVGYTVSTFRRFLVH